MSIIILIFTKVCIYIFVLTARQLSFIKITTRLVRSFVSKIRRDLGFISSLPHFPYVSLLITNKEITLPYTRFSKY